MPVDKTENLSNRSPDKFGNPDLPASPSARYLSEGEMIAGRYRIISRIGQGAMGSVYAVEQIFLQKRFALKTLNPIAATDIVLRRFHNEAQTASMLDHPNLVQAIDFGLIDDNQPFLVMDYVEGQSLSQVLQEKGRLAVDLVLQIFIPICFAMDYAHQQGVVHRDIKPGNILLAKSDSGAAGFIPKIVDFGISKLAATDEKNALTKTGEVFGTPFYMSPEQCTGTKVDKRSDIYSLGCVMFEALTGSTPFVGQTALETMMQHSTSELPSMKEASLGHEFPVALENIITKMLEKDPRNRYQSCSEVAEDLVRFQSDPLTMSVKRIAATKPQSKKGKILAAVVAVAACTISGAVGYVWYWRSNKPETKNEATKVSVAKEQDPQGSHDTSILSDLDPRPFTPPGNTFSNDVDFGPNIKFYFPPKSDLGTIFYWNTATTIAHHEATGTVDFPKTSKRILFAGSGLPMAPMLANYFQNDDFSGLVFDYDVATYENDACDRIYEPLTRLPSIRALVLRDCHISSTSSAHVSELPHLRWLSCKKSLGLNQIANLSRLRQLRVLRIEEDGKNVSTVVKRLSGSKSIKRLSLNSADISARDIELIAKCPSLTHLDLRGAFEHQANLNDKERQKCMAQLASLPNLRFLAVGALVGVESGDLKPELLRQLSAMKKLEVLYLQFPRTEEAMQQIKSHLNPNCRIIGKGAQDNALVDGWFDPRKTNPDIDDLW